MNTKGRPQRPMLLGHHSEKVKELWEKLKEKDFFCAYYGYSRTFIERVINGKQKTFTNRTGNLIKDLVEGRTIESTLNRQAKYRFLHPKTVIND